MKVVLQRVSRAAVHVDGAMVGEVGQGVVALVGAGQHSTPDDAAWLAGKTEALRIFSDEEGRMNRSLLDVGGGVLAVSQFTLYGDTRKGRRPSFIKAAEPERGEALYDAYCEALSAPVARGVFGAHMVIELVADGPVTIPLHREDGRSEG